MQLIADLHIHSKYSRATSKEMNLESLANWAKLKGIQVLGTGDFTHPLWFEEIKQQLKPAEEGLFLFKKTPDSPVRFMLTAELSCIYSKAGRVRKVHIVLFAPSLAAVKTINTVLGKRFNIKYDGRPILGLDAKELAKIVLDASPDCLVIPAHAWTPWFGIFGSKSGFNSMEECFEDYTKHIYAIETGLSSDPLMNWRWSALDNITLISNSDCHSPKKLGREANVFNVDLNYQAIINAIKTGDPKKFPYTIEFYPEEGKYHFDGHRDCGLVLSPKETKKHNGLCPSCKKPLTIGVLNRVEELADREEGFVPKNKPSFKSLVPLEEIIADALGRNTGTKEVLKNYDLLVNSFISEFNVLLNVSEKEISSLVAPEIGRGIMRMREGEVIKEPGYDGVFGKIKVFSSEDKKKLVKQKPLF